MHRIRSGSKARHGSAPRRPVVRIAPVSAWTITGNPGSKLLIEGLWHCGPDIVLEGDFDEVVFRCCTLDPGDATPTGSG